MWSSVALPALVATVVSVVVTTSLGRLGRIGATLWAVRRPDHATLDSGYFNNDNGSRPCFLCVVRCAPARSLRRPRVLPHRAASQFVTTVVSTLPATPASLTPEGARFERVFNEFGLVESAWLGANGIVEVAWPLSLQFDATDARVLMPREVAACIAAMVAAVQTGLYAKVYDTSRRLDWAVTVSAMYHDQTGVTQSWNALKFEGTPPAGRATQGAPAQPRPQFGRSQLRALRQRCPAGPIVEAVFSDWLGRSGYWDYARAIEDIVAVIDGS